MGAFEAPDAFEESQKFTQFQVGLVEEASREFQRLDDDQQRKFTFLELPSSDVGGGGYDLATAVEACLQLMAIVVVDVAAVKAFLGRWKVIEARLLQLPALLLDMVRLCENRAMCSELLKGLTGTLEEARVLAVQCTDLSYGGKLQTQSNLDSLCGRLNFHIHDCQLMVAGPPGENSVAVLSTIQELLTHLKIGSVECKQRALDAVVRIMEEEEASVVTVASDRGVVTTLVHLLDASQGELQERAATAVCLLALHDSCEGVVVAEGGIAPLVRLVGGGSARAQEAAAAALQGLSVSEENARTISAHGGAAALVAVCRAGTPAARAAAAGSLRNLAAVPELRRAIADDGAVPVIVTVLASGTAMAQENAAATLQNLAVSDNGIRCRIVEDGAVQPLIRYLDCAAQVSAQELALGALRNLAACKDNVPVLCTSGLLPRLASCLRASALAVQLVAANAVCYLASYSTDTRRSLGEAGVVSALVKLLDAKSHTLQEYTAQALALLLLVEENQRLFLADDWGITGLVLQLETRFNEVGKQYPVAALQALSGHGKCRKQMMAAGACFYLRQLAEMEVPGARRLLDRLDGGKLRNIISKTLMINSFTN